MKHAKLFTLAVGTALLSAALLLTQGCCKKHCHYQACASAVSRCNLTGSTWTLDLASLSGVKANAEKPGKPVTLVLAEGGKVHGCAGVNNYFGTAEIMANDCKLKFNPLGCTMMAGPGLDYETAFLKALASVDSYEITGGRLLLKSSGKVVAVLTAARE